MTREDDHYETLQLSPLCNMMEIKSSYRKLALQCHPDKCGDAASFQRLQQAYQVLSNPKRKFEYDAARGYVANISSDHLNLEEMEYDASENCYVSSCRCGEDYVLDQEDLEHEDSVLVECTGCSLSIQVFLPDQS